MNTCYNPFSLEGKTILVTGASSGIGRQTAIECSKLGAQLIISARNEARLQETLEALEGEGHISLTCEITDQEQLKQLVKQLPELDGMVVCAGTATTLPIKFSDPGTMHNIFEINFFGNAELVRLVYKSKKIKKGGSIVFLDSIGGVFKWAPGNGIYGSSKAALNSFMKFSALEFAPRKVRVNCICPGMVDTPLIHRGTISEEQMQENARQYPLGRYGNPEDIAYAAVYLLSDATSWMTGQSIVVDGGTSIK